MIRRRLRAVPLGLLLVALLVTSDGCAGSADCTLVGCGPTLSLRVPASLEPRADALQLCVDGTCGRPVARAQAEDLVQPELEPRGSSVEVEVRYLAGDAVVRSTSLRAPVHVVAPNGEGCEPRCTVVRARVDDGGSLVAR